jgi:hypothetical protein
MKKLLYFSTFLCLLVSCKQEEKQTLSPEALEIKNTILKQKELFDAPGIAFGIIVNDTIV